MDIDIRYVPSQANKWTVTRKIAEVLHSDEFRRPGDSDERPTNFHVQLNESSLGGVRNNSTGILTVPSATLGHRFLNFVHHSPIWIDGQKIRFFRSNQPPDRSLAVTLEKTPYINPDIEEERQEKLYLLQDALRVDKIQFGVFYRSYPKTPTQIPPRAFSIECELNFERKSLGWLRFEYDHKLIRIEVCLLFPLAINSY
jgi:RNA-dependent RNA polymerase